MRDARDAEDALLLEAGDHARLIAAYYDVILQRCLVRVPGPAGWDVAHAAIERLLSELGRGKRYTVPYRVVVHNVVTWTIKEHFQGLPLETELPADWDPSALESGFGDVDLDDLFEQLPPSQRDVSTLYYLEGLEVEAIAKRLGKNANAVHQALHNARKRLKELVSAV
jgi:DNA-directed RNA polymerase specialized sigma24 family protein